MQKRKVQNNDMVVRFERTPEEIFYKILTALISMKGEGIGKVRFEEKRDKERYPTISWDGEVHFLSKEAMWRFGGKLRYRR